MHSDSTEPSEGAAQVISRVCSVNDCNNKLLARGWCSTHYSRWVRNGTIADPVKTPSSVCLADDCERSSRAAGFCGKHYQRTWRNGTLETPRPQCEWISRDDTGRPSCQHGPATRQGTTRTGKASWSCSKKRSENKLRFSRRLRLRQFENKIEGDRLLLETVHFGDDKAQKMISLMFNEGATDPEREVARQFLRKRRSKPWQPSQTTSVGTRNTQPETKSLSALASSRGA